MKRTMQTILALAVANLTLPAFAVEQTDVGQADQATLEKVHPTKPLYSPYAGRNFPTRPLFGDTHLHTSFSMDAGAFGCRLGPRDAYRFARGEEITASTGQPVKLSRPLDFLVVADHSDGFGFFPQLMSGDPELLATAQGRKWYDQIKSGFASAWQRPPTPEELAGLVRDRVREEVYCREAMAMGLDKDDTVIRRRLRQKLDFVSDDIAAQVEPTDADLSAYLQAHPDAFRVEPRFTFRQVYLNPEKHGENLARDAAQLLAQLNQAGTKAEASALGDSFLLEHRSPPHRPAT